MNASATHRFRCLPSRALSKVIHSPLFVSTIATATALMLASAATASIRIEAYRGEPFGVGRVTVSLPSDDSLAPSSDDRFAVSDADERVLYPVIEQKRVRRLLRRFLGIQLPNRVDFYFMFRGDEPLELTVYTPGPQRFTIVPENDREEFHDLVDDWWEATEEHYERVLRAAEYPIVVDNYLTANWARRFQRPMPEPGMSLFGSDKIGGDWVAQLTAGEAYQASIERDLVLGRFGNRQAADLPLPDPPQMPPLVLPARPPEPAEGELPAPGAHVEIEPIAHHVPHECFYVRFGNYTNYLWFRDFLRHWQGDVGNMIVLRNIERGLNERLQQQIAIRDTKIARVMGPAVIRDVAMIGTDFYLRDGAAFGMLFHAKNNLLLSRNFNGQREDALDEHKGATLETFNVDGHEVSYLSTPDGKLRSYYAVIGDFHLVTTSRYIVERFCEIATDAGGRGRGRPGSLAESDEFLKARVEMPLARNDTIFLFLSAAFFENLSSPHYRIELDRRLRSIGEMRVLELARMAANAEGYDPNGRVSPRLENGNLAETAPRTIDELIEGDFLPPGFGVRGDGSQLMATDAGYRDSARGVPGWFVPVPDMPVESVTPAEAQHYAAFTRSIREEVRRFVPIVAAVGRRTSADGQIDHIIVDAHAAPYSQTGIARWARMLARDDGRQLAPIAGDVASIEVALDALGQSIHVFAGLRDFHSALAVRQGTVRSQLSPSEYIRGYLGTWPRPLTLINTLLGRQTTAFDDDGIARNDRLFDLWLRQVDDFFLFSFKRDVLLEVGPQLAMVAAERPGQIRLHVDDLTDKQIATGISGLGYMRTRAASASASRFMNSLITQLHVPPAEARDVAERLVGGRFVDPLGGQYVLVDGETAAPIGPAGEHLPTPGGRQLWASTAITPQNRFLLTEIPADYRMPLMQWFRGLTLNAGRYDPLDAVMLHAELAMTPLDATPPVEKEEEAGGFSLPSLGGLLSGWGSSDDQNANEKRPAAEPRQPVKQASREEEIPSPEFDQPKPAPLDDSEAPQLFPVDPAPAE